MSEALKINGLSGQQALEGTIRVNGSKNAALQALVFPILFKDEVVLENIPEIEDVKRMIELLDSIGVTSERIEKGIYKFNAGEKLKTDLPVDIAKKFRASVLVTGPLLGRCGGVTLSHPGGDKIGARPIDLFVEGFQKMGASFEMKKDSYSFKANEGGLSSADIFLRIQSVGPTQALMSAAVLAKGCTTIKNAAMEPEISHLAEFLNSCGAKISGAGTPTIKIEGTGLLEAKGKKYVNLPDRLETGTFLILGTLAGSDITIEDCEPKHVEILLELLNYVASTRIEVEQNKIRIRNEKALALKAVDVKTHEYPGFATDFQSPFVVLLTQANGKSMVHETIFEGRFNYVGNLIHMGAQITTCDPHRIIIKGPTPLLGENLLGPDIRAGLAYVLAAIVAKGESVIHNVYCIDRGYEDIEGRLTKIGLDIKRVEI